MIVLFSELRKQYPFACASLLLSSLPPFLSSFSFFLLKKLFSLVPNVRHISGAGYSFGISQWVCMRWVWRSC